MYHYLLDIAVLGLLLTLTIEDLRKQTFSALIPMGLALLFLVRGLSHEGALPYFQGVLFNGGFLLLLSGVLFLYARYVKGWSTLVDRGIGKGDLVFMGVLGLALSPLNFLFFLTGGATIGLIVLLVWRGVQKGVRTLPFAGILSILLGFVLLYDLMGPKSFLYDDGFLINELYGHGGG